MKKLLLSSALALSSLAVVMPTQNVMAQEVATVGSIGKGINWLAKRIYTIDVRTQAYTMTKDGVESRDYVAIFSASGALIQNYELVGGDDEGVLAAGRKAGMQILPYTVSVSNDGRTFLSVAAFAMKDMNKAYGKVDSTDYGRYNDEFWTIVNSIEAVVYEYDDSLMIDNTETHRIDLARTELKLDILGSSKPGHFLALVGKGSVGWEKQKIRTALDTYAISNSESEEFKEMAFNAKYGIGLEYNLPIGSTGALNASAMLNGGRVAGYNASRADVNAIAQLNAQGQADVDLLNQNNQVAYEQQVEQYHVDKAAYEAQHLNGVSISQDSYYELTGNALPLSPEVVKYENIKYNAPKSARTFMYLSPSMSYSGKFNKDSKTSFEINVFGNIPLRDDLKTGGVKIDLSGTNARPVLGAGIKVKF